MDNCNQRKLAAKTVQDAHAELHLANLVRRSGFIEVKGIVLNVLDHSVDVVLVYLGIVRRLYFDVSLRLGTRDRTKSGKTADTITFLMLSRFLFNRNCR